MIDPILVSVGGSTIGFEPIDCSWNQAFVASIRDSKSPIGKMDVTIAADSTLSLTRKLVFSSPGFGLKSISRTLRLGHAFDESIANGSSSNRIHRIVIFVQKFLEHELIKCNLRRIT